MPHKPKKEKDVSIYDVIHLDNKPINNDVFDEDDALDDEQEEKPFAITSASIKEELCNYGYEIKTGPCAGDKIPTRKGSAIVHEDMVNAFTSLNIHLACIDDAFKYAGKEPKTIVEIETIAKLNTIADRFKVTGFKIAGNEENEGYILVGEKWVSTGSIGLETPKITQGSGYKFFDELHDAIVVARNEVELYMNGKAAPRYEQTEMDFPKHEKEDAFSEAEL